MTKEELANRTKKFAVRTFKFVEKLPQSQGSRVVVGQLLRSSSSVAANYRAAIRGKSRADFLNKLKIVREEVDESEFWLTFLVDTGLCDESDTELVDLIKESKELIAIFSSAVKTMATEHKS